jgi:hypothetical protein
MNRLKEYDIKFKAWKKREPKPIEFLFKCLDKGWEDGRIVFRVDTDGVGVRNFYRFPRSIRGEMESVSSSKRGRMTIYNWTSKGLEERYVKRFKNWVEKIKNDCSNFLYAVFYKEWMKECPRDIQIRFTNKKGHKCNIEYFADSVFMAHNFTDWEQFPYIKTKELRDFLNGKQVKCQDRISEFVDNEENICKIKKWLKRITT